MTQKLKQEAAPAPQRSRRRAPRKLALVAAVAAVLIGTGWVLAPGSGAFASTGNDMTAKVQEQARHDVGLVGVADLVQKVAPAVVNVSVKGELPASETVQVPNFQFPPGSPFRQFFKHFFEQHHSGTEEYQAVGSGFIISPSGYIVTNNHVIDHADKITVIMQDGTKYKATLKGHDPRTDLALLKINAGKPLPYVSWGNSKKSRVGEQVVAIGNPFGLGGTVTTGIISARGRNIESGPYDDYLQVDAPINKGNSGGPLFNLKGQVIGINTAIYSPSGGSVGIGFAIPSQEAQPIIAQLEQHGHVNRGWLGVEIQPVSPQIAESLGLPSDQGGALVAQVLPNSPAAKAGLQTGDVIVDYGGREVDKVRNLTRFVADTNADKVMNLRVWRNGHYENIHVTIGRMPNNINMAEANSSGSENQSQPQATDNGAKLGIALANLNEQTRQQYNIDKSVHGGAVIVGVKPNSPAAKVGLQPGDVIVMVGHKSVKNASDAVAQVHAALGKDKKSVLLLVERNGNQRFVAVSVDKA